MKNKLTKCLFIGLLSLGTVSFGAVSAINNNKFVEASAIYTPGTTYTNGDAATYYNSIDNSLSGSELLSALTTLNLSKRKKQVGYKSMGTSASSSPYVYTDYDPKTVKYDSKGQPYGTSLLSFYSGISTTSYNKEHVWPASRLTGGRDGNVVDDDIYMPRPTISSENSNRGNSVYYEGRVSSSNGWDPVAAFADNIGVYESIRGESARIIFYCMTVDKTLVLNESTSNQGNNMGMLTHLLRWNLENPVNQREKNRNEGGEYLQGNRNAFVDHPEYACKIWGNTSETTKSICGSVSYDSVSLDKNSASLNVGDTLTLTATASDGSSSFTWTSSNTNVATVSNGVVTAVSKGSTTITISASIGGKTYTATCSVSVSDGTGPIGDHDGSLNSPYTVSEAIANMEQKASAYIVGTAKDVSYSGNLVSCTITDGSASLNVKSLNTSNVTVTENSKVTLKGTLSGSDIIAPGFIYKVEAGTNPDPDPTPDPKPSNAGGCGGSIIATSSILCASAIAGLTLVIIRRKKED